MSAAIVFGLCAAVVAGLGLYGVITNPQPLRKILAFNLLGSGVFLFFGVVARRGAAAGFRRRSDPAGAGHHGNRRRLFGDGAGGRPCCFGCFRQRARPRCAPTRRRARTPIARTVMPHPIPIPDATTTRRVPAGAVDRRPGGGRAARFRRRRPPGSSGSRSRRCRSASRSRSRSPGHAVDGRPARLSARRLGAAARRGAARRRAVGGDAGDHGGRHRRDRRLCACGLPHARGHRPRRAHRSRSGSCCWRSGAR